MNRRTGLMAICLWLVFWGLAVPATGQGVRKPAWAGQFYESDPSRLSRQLEVWLDSAGSSPWPARWWD